MENPISKHRKSKLNYLSKKNQLQKVNLDLITKQKELEDLNKNQSPVDEINKCKDAIITLESSKTKIENDISAAEKDISNSKTTALNSNLAGYDVTEKGQDYFYDIAKSSTNSFKEPHNMSDKEIVEEFKNLSYNSISWIEFCPEWQQDRLIELYENFNKDSNQQFSNDAPNPYEAIISKNDIGFYEYIKGSFKKNFTLPLGSTVTLEPNSTTNHRIILYKNEHYICVKYNQGNKLQTNEADIVEGYVKTKNVTMKAITNDIASTLQSSQDDVQGLSAASSKWFSKRKLNLTSNNTVPDNFHVNSDPSFPNPALMSDREVAEHFKMLITKDKNACDQWIDAFFIHHNRMSNIYTKVVNKVDNDLGEDKPKSLIGIIKDSNNANVYKLNTNNTLERFANLKKGDFVRVNFDPTSSTDVSFNFFQSFGKQYVPIFTLFNSKVVPGYINSNHISFVVNNDNSVLSESKTNNTVNSNNDDSSFIQTFRLTLGNDQNNPLTMSDKEISEYIETLTSFDEIYSWADSYPSQTKRIKEIYANMSTSSYEFDKDKPSQIVATITRDSAHIYPDANGIGIQTNVSKNTAKNQSITSVGTLSKGGQVRVILDTNSSNSGPTFIHHKDLTGKPTKYVKIQYLDSNLKYVDGFISVNAISIRTIEDEVSEIIDSVISAPTDKDTANFDLSLTTDSTFDLIESSLESLGSSVGEGQFSYADEEDSVGSLDKYSYDMSITGFSQFSSLLAVVNALKGYGSAITINNILNQELVTLFSSTNSLLGGTLGIATTYMPSENKHIENLTEASNISSYISCGIENIKFLYEQVPAIWNSIKHREAPNPEEILEKVMGFLSTANTTLGLFSDLSTAIPIVSAAINILNSFITFITDLVKFIMIEIQIWKMYRQKQLLKSESLSRRKLLDPQAQEEQKLKRAERLDSINQEMKKLEFKGQHRDANENTKYEDLKNERLEYMDLFITTEVENINKKRRNRNVIALSQDLLNLTGDIAALIGTAIPEPNTILAASMTKLGTKAASAALGAGAAATRNIKQWYRDRNDNNPKSTKNKQKKNARIAAGMVNNIINLPKPPVPPANNINDPEYLKQKAFAEKRYLLVQSHIIAAGTSVAEVEKCNGDPKEIFSLFYATLLTRG